MTLRVLHGPGDHVSDEIRRTGEPFELVILEELARRLTRPGVIVDVGAHIGNHTAYFAERLPHTRIHAFEPWPANVDRLLANVADYSTVEVHPHALSNRCRQLRMLADDNLGHVRVDAAGRHDVEAYPLDEFELIDVTLIKIDVEGHEPEVLAGAEQTIRTSHPLILIEDWRQEYGALLPGYRVAMDWSWQHQTFLYEWTR